ncbi:hypothetical protein ES707_08291 [subsurface metagenome]
MARAWKSGASYPLGPSVLGAPTSESVSNALLEISARGSESSTTVGTRLTFSVTLTQFTCRILKGDLTCM